ncbi:MAG TPA: hypothetical protein VMW01_13110 [Williamwhitmania sp.]|nr:hypothetical protein [Williamwhitmania sp.]
MRLLILPILLVALFTSCQKEGNDSLSPVSGKLQKISEKDTSKSGAIADSIGNSTIISYSYDAASQKLTITHQNACFSCSCDSIRCHVTNSGNSIMVEEREYNGNSSCLCLYDLKVEVDGVTPDVYLLHVIEPHLGEQAPIRLNLDLAHAPKGTLYFPRPDFPWGLVR